MTLEMITRAVASSNADTLIAQRFREALGIPCAKTHEPNRITRRQYTERIRKADIMACMAQRTGALDRVR